MRTSFKINLTRLTFSLSPEYMSSFTGTPTRSFGTWN